jgi:hypothetical protein
MEENARWRDKGSKLSQRSTSILYSTMNHHTIHKISHTSVAVVGVERPMLICAICSSTAGVRVPAWDSVETATAESMLASQIRRSDVGPLPRTLKSASIRIDVLVVRGRDP